MTEISLEDFHAPATEAGLVLATEVDASIAPWVDIPPTPPPKPKKASFAFPRSPSFDKNPLAILTRLRPSRSKARLLPPPDPALESYVSFHNGLPPVPALPFPKRASADRKARPLPQQPQSPQPQHPEIFLDRNLDDMEGIIDLTALPPHSQDGASGSSHSDPFASVASFAPFDSPPAPLFTTANPFSPSPVPAAPRRRPSVPTLDPLASLRSANGEPPDDPSWKPPQSWGFVKNGDDDEQGEPAYSSSSDESALSPTATAPVRRPPPAAAAPAPDVPYAIRIYRANNTYHVAAIALHTTVAELVSVLNTKLLSDAERETHRLYLKERGRERVLAHTERPADIVRRRLEQAGYDAADGLDKLGAEDMPFLLKFMYKSQLLGKEGELNLEAFEYVDLTGRGLRTVPVVLHNLADTIVSLTLSRNPMLEIPPDFVQSCSTMQRVPHSIRHSTAMFRLDLLCNRIADLGGAGLDALAELSKLNLRNNRLAALPPDFARHRSYRQIRHFQKLFLAPGFLAYGDTLIAASLIIIFYFAPKYGKMHVLLYIGICSMIAGISVSVMAGLGAAIVTIVMGSNQFKHWFIYLLFVFVATTLVTEVFYLNVALALFNTAMVTFCFMVTTVVLFDGLRAPASQILAAVFASLVICLGVTLLQMSKLDPQMRLNDAPAGCARATTADADENDAAGLEDPGIDSLHGSFGTSPRAQGARAASCCTTAARPRGRGRVSRTRCARRPRRRAPASTRRPRIDPFAQDTAAAAPASDPSASDSVGSAGEAPWSEEEAARRGQHRARYGEGGGGQGGEREPVAAAVGGRERDMPVF